MSDAELVEIAGEFRGAIVGTSKSSFGMCLAVAAPLQSYIAAAGVKCSLVEFQFNAPHVRTNHLAVLLDDGRLLDPTADQFATGLPKVYLGPIPDEYTRWDKRPTPMRSR